MAAPRSGPAAMPAADRDEEEEVGLHAEELEPGRKAELDGQDDDEDQRGADRDQ